jgi:hypothetical protein
VKQAYPSETLEGFHGQVVKHIPIAHALFSYEATRLFFVKQ